MSNRGMIFLGVGMLLLGLVLGGASGGIAGYFMGQNSMRGFASQFNQPFAPNQQPFGPNAQPFNQNPPGNFGQRGMPQIGSNGARVLDVEANSASEKAGLKAEDVITAVAGTKIDDTHSLADLVKAHKPGEKIELSVTRGTQNLTITVELGASASDSSAAYLGIRYAPALANQGRRPFQ